MLIGTLARETGFSRDTIRYYEKIGLIPLTKAHRRPNDYKEYPDYLVERLKAIREAKQYGFSLEEIREFLSLWDEGLLSCEDVENKISIKIQDIEAKIRSLENMKVKLEQANKGERCPGDYCSLEFNIKF